MSHHQFFFPFHLLQPDDETNLFEYPDNNARHILPQNAAQKWLRNCGALPAANETLPQFFINKHPERRYIEMTTNLKSSSAYGERVTDSTFERYLRKTIYWRQVTWDTFASEQCKQLVGTDEEHSMLFAAVFSTDAVDKIRVHNFHLRLMHAVFTFFQQNFRVVELGNQQVDYASLNTLFEWMLQVDEESKKSVGFSLQRDMVKCIVLYLSRHKYFSKFVTTMKSKNKRKCAIEQLRFTDKFDPTDQQFLQDDIVHPLDRELFKEIIKLRKQKHARGMITVDRILDSLCHRRTFMMKGLLWAIRMCPFLFFTVYNPNTKTCIVIFNRGVDSELVPAFERGYNEQLLGPMPLYHHAQKRARSRKKQTAMNDHDISEDELAIPKDHLDFYVVEDDGDDQSNAEDSGSSGQESISVSHRMESASSTTDMASHAINSNDRKKRKRAEMESQGYLFVNVNGTLRDHQKRFAIDCIRFMKDKSSDGYSIALTELTSRMTLLLPVIRTQHRAGDVLRVIRRFPDVFAVSTNSISLTGQVPSIEHVEEVLQGNSSDIFLFRKIISSLQTESDISMDIDEMADRMDTEFLAADLRFTLSCVPDVFAIFTSKKSPDAPSVTMVRLLKPNVDPAKIVLVKKAKKLRTDGRNRNPEISYF